MYCVIRQHGASWKQIQCKEKPEDRFSAQEIFDKKLSISTNILWILLANIFEIILNILEAITLSKQAREKNAHLTCGVGRWLIRRVKAEGFYKLLTWTRLENNLWCQYQKNAYGSFRYFSMLYDEVILAPSSQLGRHTHAHIQKRS